MHAQWSIKALLEYAKKLGIAILPEDYKSFFALLSTECDDDDNTYISWKCTPNKKTMCEHAEKKWEEITDALSTSDDNTTVPFTHFKKKVCLNAKGDC